MVGVGKGMQRVMGIKMALVLGLLPLQSVFSDQKVAPYIPPSSHLTIATPGSKWLNTSRPLVPDDLRGRIVLLDFWTFCCINCIHTLPELAKLEKEFKDDLLVIGVHSAKFDNEKETDQIRNAILRYGVEHPVVNDFDFRIWKTFGVRSWPTLVLLKADGTVEKSFVGEGNTEEIRKAIRTLLKTKNPKPTSKLPIELESKKETSPSSFLFPSKLAFDSKTKTLFVTDSSQHQIAAFEWNESRPQLLRPLYRIGASGKTGFREGSYSEARFRRPQGLLLGKDVLFVADTENHAVRKVDLKSKRVSTLAGTGRQGSRKQGEDLPAKSTPLASPWDLSFHPDESTVVIAMAGTHQLWSLDLKKNTLSVIAGNGLESIDDGLPGENSLSQPSGVSSLLGSLYFVDSETSSLRFYFEGYVRTLVGTGLFDFGFKDGHRKKAQLQHPLGLYADVTGIYIADTYNHAIRRYDPALQKLETVVGDGRPGRGGVSGPEEGSRFRLNEPSAITKLSDSVFIVSDTNNHRLVLWNRITQKAEPLLIENEKSSLAPKEKNVARDWARELPQLRKLPAATTHQIAPDFSISLPERHKINGEAPSFVALFRSDPSSNLRGVGSALKVWNREALQKNLKLRLPELKSGESYVLQGSIYYCLDGAGATCEIQSFELPFQLDPKGSGELRLEVKPKGAEELEPT